MKEYIIHGIPLSLQRDAWWLCNTVTQNDTASNKSKIKVPRIINLKKPSILAALLFVLIVIADFLFWDHRIGVSLAYFGIMLIAALFLVVKRNSSLKSISLVVTFTVLSILPILEHVQLLSVLYYCFGLIGISVWITFDQHASIYKVISGSVRFLIYFPWLTVKELSKDIRVFSNHMNILRNSNQLLFAWCLPIVVGVVFIVLFVLSNPVIEVWLNNIANSIDKISLDVFRLIFWIIAFIFISPFLFIDRIRERLSIPFPKFAITNEQDAKPVGTGIFNVLSISNSLIVFNLIFAIQTALDLAYLWGGAELPDGVTYAQYAHRGAYPLVATAILAGAFALLSRPYIEGHSRLRTLLTIWVCQNVILVVSSIYRLDLYIDQFGFTYWRIAAVIWMALVTIGLVLTLWQFWFSKSNSWLLQKNLIILAVVMYGCCFINFGQFIAASNFSRATIHNGSLLQVDRRYNCKLGPHAARAVKDFKAKHGINLCNGYGISNGPQIDGWRDWGFRSWRVMTYISEIEAKKDFTDVSKYPNR